MHTPNAAPAARDPSTLTPMGRVAALVARATTTATITAAAMLLAACNGGDDPVGPAASSAAAPSDPGAGNARRRALHTLSDDLLGEALAITLFPYIEQNFADYFPGTQPTQALSPYLYRCYPGTGNCVGFTAQDLYALGPVVGNTAEPVWVSSIADFCDTHPAACGLKVRRTLTIDGLERRYIVYLPWRIRNQADIPTVFMLHGTSGTGDEFYDHSGWREKADAEGLIAVFPTALRHCFFEDENGDGDFDDAGERKTPTKWADSFLGAPEERPLCTAEQRASLPDDVRAAVDHPLADDVAFFRAMVEDVTTNFAADPKRIYVSGFSNGAQMTLRLAHEASTLIAAAASNAGGARASLDGPTARAMSMVYAVGDRDDRYGASAENPLPLTDEGSGAFYRHTTQPFLGVLGLSDAYTWQSVTLYDRPMSVYLHTTSTLTPAGGNHFYAVVMQGIGHSYPNFMPDLLWTFFRDKSLP